MSKGTIIYVGNFELPDKSASANRVMNNRKLFSEIGYRVVMLGVVHEQFGGVRISSYDQDIYEEAYPSSTVSWAKHMGSIQNIKAVAEKYSDVKMILLYNVPYLLVNKCKNFFGKRNVKVCYDCTEWTPVTDGSFAKRLIKKWDCELIRNRLGKKADGLIVVSKTMQNAYQRNMNLLYLPPLVDITESIWHPDSEYVPEKYEFCFAGMLDGDKDSLDLVVKSFSLLNDQKAILRIIGVTKEEFLIYYPELKSDLEKLGDSILFMGLRSHTETIRYVLGCNCYIFIRKSDMRNQAGFPTKFVEAFTCGVNVITTDISDVRLYENESIRVVPKPDTDLITNEMKNVMRKKANNKIRDSFDYRRYIKVSEKFFGAVLHEVKESRK